MATRSLERGAFGQDEDWHGNNAAVCCPLCSKLFIVSGFIDKGQRQCPRCGQSTAQITDEKVVIEWPDAQDDPKIYNRSQLASAQKLDEFVNLVNIGGAVREESVKEKLPKALRIAVIERQGKIVAAAAIKEARPTYARKISGLSGHQLFGDIPELGYVVVARHCQGKHMASKVVQRILVECTGSLFATTSDSKMKHVLANNGFRWIGHEWPSEQRPDEKLSLWIRETRQ